MVCVEKFVETLATCRGSSFSVGVDNVFGNIVCKNEGTYVCLLVVRAIKRIVLEFLIEKMKKTEMDQVTKNLNNMAPPH